MERRDEAAAIVSTETGKSRKDARARRAPPSRWASSSPARGAASTAGRRRARCRTGGDDRPPAARVGRPDHRRQHADRERRLEGVPGAALRQRGGPEAVRGHAGDGAGRSRGSLHEAGVPDGVLSVVHGFGEEAGAPLVEHRRSRSSASPARARSDAGSQRTAGERLAKVCLELGGKNPLIVCDDADLDAGGATRPCCRRSATPASAARRAAASSCSTPSTTSSGSCSWSAPRRCRSGPGDDDDFGPVINEQQLRTCSAPSSARAQAGWRHAGLRRRRGSTTRPTPAATSWRRRSSSTPGPTRDLARRAVRADHLPLPRARLRGGARAGERLAVRADGRDPHAQHPPREDVPRAHPGRRRVVNGPTYGSEPHMPFGGLRQSGNGWREAGHRGARRLLGLEDRLHQA